MPRPLTLLVESEILPGKARELREVLARVIAHCGETEPGMLAYDWYIDAQEQECRVVERYADSDAVLFHFENYARFGAQLAACRSLQKLTLLGEPSEALAGLAPGSFAWLTGLERES